MSQIPAELKYVASHEWIRHEGNGLVTIGITDHAQELLGDIVYIELPTVGKTLGAGEATGVVESVKAASDIYSPLDGDVVEINTDLEGAPDVVNNDPYGSWFFKLQLKNVADLDTLLDATAYASEIGA